MLDDLMNIINDRNTDIAKKGKEMSKLKSTPGPWDIWKGQDDTSNILAVGPVRIARLPRDTGDFCKEDYANAHLVSSAPELLEALEALTKDVDQYGLHHPDGSSNFWLVSSENAKAAIAKSKGE